MLINRVWAMPNKWTFKIKPIRELLERYNVGKNWADPFCGMSTLAEFRNDLNLENTNALYHLESLEFAYILPNELDGVVFDPPYSLYNIMKNYKSVGRAELCKTNPAGSYPKTKDVLANKVKNNGHVITFGWNSVGFGKKRGFEIVEILLVCHGAHVNDTIVTVEKKIINFLI